MDGCPDRRTGREDLKDLQGRKYTAQSELDFLRCVLVEDRTNHHEMTVDGKLGKVWVTAPRLLESTCPGMSERDWIRNYLKGLKHKTNLTEADKTIIRTKCEKYIEQFGG